MATLSSVISVLPKVPEVTLPDDTDCFEELKPRPLRKTRSTAYDYNLSRYTFLPVESAVAIDMMHMMHNLFDLFVPFLLGKSIDLTGKDTATDAAGDMFSQYNKEKKKVLLNNILHQGREKWGMVQSKVNCVSVTESIAKAALERFNATKDYPENVTKWIGGLFGGTKVPIRGEEKICFCAAILPYLMIDSMEDIHVFSIVTILSTLVVIYNYDGVIEELQMMDAALRVCLSLLEMVSLPNSFTIYLHKTCHLLLCYIYSGTLKSTDTLHPESMYCEMRDQATGGSLPVQTIQMRRTIVSAARLLSYDLESKPTLTSAVLGNVVVFLKNHSVDKIWVKMMSTLNWISDSVRFNRDMLFQMTDLDLQLNGWVDEYISKELRFNGKSPASQIREYREWDMKSVKAVFDEVVKSGGYGYGSDVFMFSLTWNSVLYESCTKPVRSLNVEHFKKGVFGVVYSLTKKTHLFMISGYICNRKKDELYLQALCYEIPKYSANPLIDNPFAFIVDTTSLKNYTRKPLLISLHRLIVSELFFKPLDSKRVYCGVSTVCIREWKLIQSVMQKPSEECKKQLDLCIVH